MLLLFEFIHAKVNSNLLFSDGKSLRVICCIPIKMIIINAAVSRVKKYELFHKRNYVLIPMLSVLLVVNSIF